MKGIIAEPERRFIRVQRLRAVVGAFMSVLVESRLAVGGGGRSDETGGRGDRTRSRGVGIESVF